MAVYREGYHAVEEIEKNYTRIWDDACDEGALVKKDDDLWNWTKQLVEWYGVKGTRKVNDYANSIQVEHEVKLMDEWAYSDGRKSESEAIERFKVSYYMEKRGIRKGSKKYDGFVRVERIN